MSSMNDNLFCTSLQLAPLDVKSWHMKIEVEFSTTSECSFSGKVVSVKQHTTVVLLPWTCCFFIIRIRTIWNDWATGLWEGVLKNTGMLLYPLLQSRCSKKSSSIACIQGLSKPCGILGTWGSGTDLSAMSVANSCGLFSFLGGQEAQSLPSHRAQRNASYDEMLLT